MGFGYINDGSRAVEVPATPASPLKSALRVPGTPGRVLSPMSATFREEQVLEKQEAATEKEQAKDLVCLVSNVKYVRELMMAVENQDSRASSQGRAPMYQFQLLSDRLGPGGHYICHLQCDQGSGTA